MPERRLTSCGYPGAPSSTGGGRPDIPTVVHRSSTPCPPLFPRVMHSVGDGLGRGQVTDRGASGYFSGTSTALSPGFFPRVWMRDERALPVDAHSADRRRPIRLSSRMDLT